MSQHVPDDLLKSFVEGEVGEQVAVHVAEHLDTCPACATRAAGMEPLAPAFAAIEDPIPPPDLVPAVLSAVSEPERLPVLEVGLGAVLILAAALLTLLAQSPLHLATELATALHLLQVAARGLATGLGATSLPAVLASLGVLLGGIFLLRLATTPPVRLPRRLS